ncbi:MAG TPA: nuclear transport factor 2 family protein [Saprospiraceae bacterium]|nr:nuclear transport factor 2 family protein [Saprospiraceae bacterium]
MKYLLILAWLTLSYGVRAQNNEESEIRRVLAAQEADWNRADIEAFMEGYWKSDSLMFIGARGVTYGWQPTLDSYKKGYPNAEAMGKLTFTIYSLQVLSPESAYIIGKWHLARAKDEVGGHFTLLWKKIGGKWVIVADHTS